MTHQQRSVSGYKSKERAGGGGGGGKSKPNNFLKLSLLRCAQKIVTQLERGEDRENNNTQVGDSDSQSGISRINIFFTRTPSLSPWISITRIWTN